MGYIRIHAYREFISLGQSAKQREGRQVSKKVWVVTLEKNVYINVEVSKDDAQTEDEAIDKAFEDLSYDDKKNYEFVSITEEVMQDDSDQKIQSNNELSL